jgi:tetratricopeptide (TPR) repeat protein
MIAAMPDRRRLMLGRRAACLCASAAAFALSLRVGGFEPGQVVDFARNLVRPVTLPLQWRALAAATADGNPAEVFAQAQSLLRMLPTWADGHIVFAFRYALDGAAQQRAADAAAGAALARLRVALAFCEEAIAADPRHRQDLLVAMGFLVELAAEQQPGLAEQLRGGSAAGDPAAIADRYLERAEAAGGNFDVGEMRIFAAPRLCAAFLREGERDRAIAVLDRTLARIPEVKDRQLATEWQTTLTAVRRILTGDRSEPVAPLLEDPRLAPIHSFLR